MFEVYRNLCKNHNELFMSQYLELLKNNTAEIKKLQDQGYNCTLKVIENSNIEEKTKKQILLYLRYISSVCSLENTVFNHEVIEEIVKTKGQSLLNGMYNFVDDFSNNLEVRTHNKHAFKIGKNIAATQGNVVYENELVQLIYYNPSKSENYASPFLIVPPWINKYYILDLQQHNSFAKFFVDAGFPVFIVSWVNPDSTLANKGLEEYLLEGLIPTLRHIQNFFPESSDNKVNILGYCIGGTLVTAMLGYLKAKNIDFIKSATFLATLADFNEVGDLGAFINETQISIIEHYMKTKGYFDGNDLRAVFNLLKAEDMIAKPFINNYLMGKEPFAFDILYWNSDSTNIPYKLHSDILRMCYLNNLLIKPNGISIAKTPIDVNKIDIPLCFVVTESDHIIPWQSVFETAKSNFSASVDKKFILAGSGHVAGIINPPIKNKYYYISHNINKKSSMQDFDSKSQVVGSWWNELKDWLKSHSGQLKPSFIATEKNIIEPAPGRYVKKSINPAMKNSDV